MFAAFVDATAIKSLRDFLQDLDQILQEITQGLDRCRIDKRRKHPNTFQLLSDPTLQQTDLVVSSEAGGP